MSELLERIALCKAKWSVPELVEQLLGEPVPASRKVNSPFNDADNTPSFHCYDDSFYCYSTGNYGDVVDLVRLLKRCTVERAVQILEEEADDLGLVASVRVVAPKPVFKMPEGIYFYDGMANFWEPPVIAGVTQALLAKLWWGCRIGRRQHDLAILHYNPTSTTIMGIKYRAGPGKKFSEPGSDFSSYLYQPFEYAKTRLLLRASESLIFREGPLVPTSCVITEGETDSWAWLSQRPNDHVFSLPSGAQSWKDKFLAQLEQYTKVYICFDSDEAGLRARDKVTNAVGWGRAEHVQTPLKDVRDSVAAGWQPPVIG